MMHDNLDPHVSEQAEPATSERAAIRDEAASTQADREVPIAAANTPEIIHAWLDGEPVDEAALQAAGGYAFWRQVKAETDRRRRMRTPTPISGSIMEAIRKEG